MARTALEDPIKAWRWRVFIAGVVRLGCTECNGFSVTNQKINYAEGGNNDYDQKSAGRSEWADITLKRGQIIGSALGGENDWSDWTRQVMNVAAAGNALNYRREMECAQYNSLNQEAERKRVYNAFPSMYRPNSDLGGSKNENSFEEIQLTHEGWEKV